MADELYTSDLGSYSGPISKSVQEAIEEIKVFFELHKVDLLTYDEYSIAIPVVFDVSLPMRGAVGGIDIREQEPCFIRIFLDGYPYAAPYVYSDRKNFPRQFLGHLYVTQKGSRPGGFCLVRNNVNEWFADKKLTDLLKVAAEWLFKAGTGKLNEDGGEFDPTRLERFRGYHIYKYDLLREIVESNLPFLPDYSFALLLTCVFKQKNEAVYKSLSAIPFIQLENTRKLIEEYNIAQKESRDALLLVSLLVWRDDNAIDGEYCTTIPRNFGELKSYFQTRGIDIEPILSIYKKSYLQYSWHIPIIHAIRRPKKMIGYDGNLEFINFKIEAKDFTEHNFPIEAKVRNQSHIEPFSKELANKLSGEQRSVSTLYIGGGSLGSKIFMHDVRSGKLNIGVVDADELLQHNLTRHVLYNNHVGSNKADALTEEAKAFFLLDNTDQFKSYPYNIQILNEDGFKNYNWIVDSTASNNVQNWLVSNRLSQSTVARCELAHLGQLGLLYIEGKNRNPRIDDLINLTYFLATKNDRLKAWREYDSKTEEQNLSVGLGCSSTTTITADDTISFHASLFSKILHQESERKNIGDNALLYRTIIEGDAFLSVKSEHEVVKPFEIYACFEGSGWEVRFANGLKEKLLLLCNRKGQIETGGILIGIASYKTKTIHVFDIVIEPQDSSGTCTGFTRGIKGLPELVNQIKEDTGQAIGYIGEWHSHPMDLESLSGRDRETIKELQKLNRKVPIPTLAVIVTTKKVLPFVFE